MDFTPQTAQDSLDEVRKVMRETRAAIASSGASLILMFWGVIWFMAFGVTQFWPERAGWFWLVGDFLGVMGTIWIASGIGRRRPVRSPTLRRVGWRVFWFWCALSAYAWLWYFLLPPMSGLQVSAFMTTIVMLAYVVIGLWFEAWFMIVLGLAITALVAAGYWLWPGYYCVSMALVGGGALFGSGLYMRLRWR